MTDKLVTIIGGAGFLGKAIIRELCKQGFRVRAAVRNPHQAQHLRTLGDPGQVDLRQANLRYPASLAAACQDAYAVINCVGLLYEKGRQNFAAIHVRGAQAAAEAAKAADAERFVQISAIGAAENSRSGYARTKAQGEAAVRTAFPAATILRPSIVIGEEDSFFNRFGAMAQSVPALPIIGGGRTRMQPIFVGDVARAVAASIIRQDSIGRTYELGGPNVYAYRDLMRIIVRETRRSRALASIPFFVMGPIGATLDFLLRLTPIAPPVTGDQIEMLKSSNVVGASGETGVGDIADLGVTDLESAEAVAAAYMWRFRPKGQFSPKG